MTSPLDAELAAVEEAIREGDWGMFDAGTLAEGLEDRDGTVLELVYACAICDQPLPEWLRREFCLRYVRGALGQLRSWDEAFGHPTTRAHADRAARARYTKCEVFDLVVEAKKSGRSVTDDLFEEVGRKVGLARETTKKLYAAAGGGRLAARVLSYSKK